MRHIEGVGTLAERASEGLVAGVAATAAMSLFTAALLAAVQRAGVPEREVERLGRCSKSGDAPTEALAASVERAALGRRPTRREKELGGKAVHWTFGALLGALYAAMSAKGPTTLSGGRGLLFGGLLWLGVSEAALPTLGLSLGPTACSPAGHALNLVTHLIYGGALDLVNRALHGAVVSRA